MANLRYVAKSFFRKSDISHLSPFICSRRFSNYCSMSYDDTDPSSTFLNKNVQSLLRSLTRVNYEKVFRKRKLNTEKLSDPEYKFMTDAELQEALEKAKQTAEELLQIPPILKVRSSKVDVLSKDPALQGLETSRMVFTDITFGIKDADRLIVVREPDGTLQEAEWQLRQRIHQIYFPQERKYLKTPAMFNSPNFESLLDRFEYEYILDRACVQFEPDDPDYQRVVTITYQHLNDNNKFELLRSTRHFAALTFFLVWNKNIDNLLLELIQTLHIAEAEDLVNLYSLVHQVQLEGKDSVDVVQDFIRKAGIKKGALELAIQAYKDVSVRRVATN